MGNKCNLEVKAKVIDRWTEETSYYKRHPYRSFIMIEYEYNNQIYTKEGRISPFSKIRIGDIGKAAINPDNPKECTDFTLEDEKEYKKRFSWKDKIITLILLLPVFSIIIDIILFLIMTKRGF